MLILGIETSCDETAASVVKDGESILSSIISSSMKYHRKFGGVIPEIATRHHAENIDAVIIGSLRKAGADIGDIDAVAVTQGPGLAGALLTGISCAKSIAYSLDVPLLAVDHVKAHLYSALIGLKNHEFPFIGLVVSGGHTRILLVKDYDDVDILGDTLDDAVGEAYDKVAKILGLGYPGGPIIDSLAKKGNPSAVKFTCRAIDGGLDFSFSGIKTAVLYHVRSRTSRLKPKDISDICASFQESVLKVVVGNTVKAMEKHRMNRLVIGGGVSANSRLRQMIQEKAVLKKFEVYFPLPELCSDNAAMIAGLAHRLYEKGFRSGLEITAQL
jgi:N6-L-threonylcarbamoyladenine synthase